MLWFLSVILMNMNTPQIYEKSANHNDSIAFLKSKGMRLLSYQEALVWLDKDSEAKSKLKGRWFYLAGNGTELSGFYTFDDKGELKEGKGELEKNVYVCDGNNPLSLGVHTDDFARDVGRRFALYAGYVPSYVARVVVGVKTSSKEVLSRTTEQILGQEITIDGVRYRRVDEVEAMLNQARLDERAKCVAALVALVDSD